MAKTQTLWGVSHTNVPSTTKSTSSTKRKSKPPANTTITTLQGTTSVYREPEPQPSPTVTKKTSSNTQNIVTDKFLGVVGSLSSGESQTGGVMTDNQTTITPIPKPTPVIPSGRVSKGGTLGDTSPEPFVGPPAPTTEVQGTVPVLPTPIESAIYEQSSPLLGQTLYQQRISEQVGSKVMDTVDKQTTNVGVPTNQTLRVSWEDAQGNQKTSVTKNIERFQEKLPEGSSIFKITDHSSRNTYFETLPFSQISNMYESEYRKQQPLYKPESMSDTQWKNIESGYRSGRLSGEDYQKSIIASEKPSFYKYVSDEDYADIMYQQSIGVLKPDKASEKLWELNESGMQNAPKSSVITWGKQNLRFGENRNLTFDELKKREPAVVLKYDPQEGHYIDYDYKGAVRAEHERLWGSGLQGQVASVAKGTADVLTQFPLAIGTTAGYGYRALRGEEQAPLQEQIGQNIFKGSYGISQASQKYWDTGDALPVLSKTVGLESPFMTDIALPMATGGAFSAFGPAIGHGLGKAGSWIATKSPTLAKIGSTTSKLVSPVARRVGAFAVSHPRITQTGMIGGITGAFTAPTAIGEYTGELPSGATAEQLARVGVGLVSFSVGAKVGASRLGVKTEKHIPKEAFEKQLKTGIELSRDPGVDFGKRAIHLPFGKEITWGDRILIDTATGQPLTRAAVEARLVGLAQRTKPQTNLYKPPQLYAKGEIPIRGMYEGTTVPPSKAIVPFQRTATEIVPGQYYTPYDNLYNQAVLSRAGPPTVGGLKAMPMVAGARIYNPNTFAFNPASSEQMIDIHSGIQRLGYDYGDSGISYERYIGGETPLRDKYGFRDIQAKGEQPQTTYAVDERELQRFITQPEFTKTPKGAWQTKRFGPFKEGPKQPYQSKLDQFGLKQQYQREQTIPREQTTTRVPLEDRKFTPKKQFDPAQQHFEVVSYPTDVFTPMGELETLPGTMRLKTGTWVPGKAPLPEKVIPKSDFLHGQTKIDWFRTPARDVPLLSKTTLRVPKKPLISSFGGDPRDFVRISRDQLYGGWDKETKIVGDKLSKARYVTKPVGRFSKGKFPEWKDLNVFPKDTGTFLDTMDELSIPEKIVSVPTKKVLRITPAYDVRKGLTTKSGYVDVADWQGFAPHRLEEIIKDYDLAERSSSMKEVVKEARKIQEQMKKRKIAEIQRVTKQPVKPEVTALKVPFKGEYFTIKIKGSTDELMDLLDAWDKYLSAEESNVYPSNKDVMTILRNIREKPNIIKKISLKEQPTTFYWDDNVQSSFEGMKPITEPKTIAEAKARGYTQKQIDELFKKKKAYKPSNIADYTKDEGFTYSGKGTNQKQVQVLEDPKYKKLLEKRVKEMQKREFDSLKPKKRTVKRPLTPEEQRILDIAGEYDYVRVGSPTAVSKPQFAGKGYQWGQNLPSVGVTSAISSRVRGTVPFSSTGDIPVQHMRQPRGLVFATPQALAYGSKRVPVRITEPMIDTSLDFMPSQDFAYDTVPIQTTVPRQTQVQVPIQEQVRIPIQGQELWDATAQTQIPIPDNILIAQPFIPPPEKKRKYKKKYEQKRYGMLGYKEKQYNVKDMWSLTRYNKKPKYFSLVK